MMKAIVFGSEGVYDGFGPPSVLQVGDRPIPAPGTDEVLIKVEYSAYNRADTMQRKGTYPHPPGATDILGLECGGRVVLDPTQAGKEDETLGRSVIALLPGGGYAQYAKVHKDHIINVPEGVDLEVATGITEVWATAFQILHLISKVQAGETVLVHAAASGVGTAMIQLAKIAGVKTIAVASSDKKLEVCTSLGADHVINYRETPEFQEKVMELTGNIGVEVVADPVGASNATRNMAALAKDGRWVLYGFLGGADIANFNLRPMLMKRLSLLVTSLKSRSNDYKRDLLAAMGATVFKDGTLAPGVKPILDRVFPMSQAADAHTYMEENGSVGKTLLKVDF